MKKLQLFLVVVLLATTAFAAYQMTTLKVKGNDYAVNFKGKRVEGGFKGLKATINLDETNVDASSITATIDVNTINTGNWLKNSHAKSEHGLDADHYPTIAFVSSKVTRAGGGYIAMGKLTIKGISKDLNLPFTYIKNGNEGVLKGHFSIVPADYNITKSGTPDQMDIDLNIPVVK